jgi:hypothetical protein
MMVDEANPSSEWEIDLNLRLNMYLSSISNAAHTARDFVVHHSSSLPTLAQMAKNVKSIAMPAMALAVVSSLPGASAGPWAAALCIISCTGLITAPPLYGACLTVCGVAGAIPGPF